MSGLIASVAVNIGIGWMIGFLTGILIKAFETAGALVDLAGGLNASQVFDPLTGTQNAVLAKLFNLTAIALWFVLGGDRLMVEGLAATVKAIPLDGLIRLSDGLLPLAVNLVGSMLQAAVELGLPALAALFVAEVTFGLAAKFAPQANVFAIGLPVKLVAALATVGFVVAGFPSAVSVSIDSIREITITAIKGLGG